MIQKNSNGMMFFVLMYLQWIFLFSLTSSHLSLKSQIIFSILSTSLSYYILLQTSYFHPVRLLPRKSNLILLISANTIASILTHLFFILIGKKSFLALPEVLIWNLIITSSLFTLLYIFQSAALVNGKKTKIALFVNQDERKRIIEDFALSKMNHYIHFINEKEYAKLLIGNNLKDIDLIIISRNSVVALDPEQLLMRAQIQGIPIVDILSASEELTGRIRTEDHCAWSYLISSRQRTPALQFFSSIKNFLEPILATILLILFLPLIAIISLLIKYTSKGPILFKQVRTGFHGKNFILYKFRSMHTNAEVSGPQFALANDTRTTKIGNLLRSSRLDELPQLWNVIRGDMQFFGPRPERPEMYQLFKSQIPLFRLRTVVKPGITGWAQVCFGYTRNIEESRIKLEFDLYYIKNTSPRLDLVILIKTLSLIISGGEKHSSDQLREQNFTKEDLLQHSKVVNE